MKELIVVLLCVYILAGCASHKIKYGKVDIFGRVYYPLCERSKQRITELQNISFELPDLFKQVSCKDEGIYHLHTANDLLNISTPSTIRGSNELSVYSMQFSSGIWYSYKKHYWMYRENTFSPEVFLEYKKDWHQLHEQIPIEYGWVNIWSGGRCARFQFRNDSSSDYINEVQYYCWPHSPREWRQVPFRISATQSIAKKVENISVNLDFTDIDNELIKPVMDSLEFHPLPDEALQFIADRFDRICHLHHSFFYKKNQGDISDFPDRRMIIRVMRDCGHEVADPPITVDSYDDIFEKKPDEELRYPTIGTLYPQEYQLIEVIYPYRKLSYEQFIQQGEEYIQRVRNRPIIVWNVYKIPREKFARIEQKLMALDLLKETMPVTRRMQDYSQQLRFHINVPYDAWYYVPPRYQRGNGFGLRYDQELHARVMDINFDSDTALGYKFITLVEGD